MALYFHFNESTGDLVYSDQASYDASGYTSLGQQTSMNPTSASDWVFDSKRENIKTVTKDPTLAGMIAGLTGMSNMFNGCSGLTRIDLSGFDTSQVASMGNMFQNCHNLTSLDLSGFDTSQVTEMGFMFNGCSGLTSLDLSGFDTSKVTTSMNLMFNGCSNLRLVAISGFMSNVLSQLPADQYYPASDGDPVAKASLTAGTWIRDEADLSKIATMVEQAQAFAALRRDAGKLERRIAALEKAAG